MGRLAEMLYWPVQNIVVWGFFTIYLSRDNHLKPSLASFLLGAAILWGMFYAFQRDLAAGFLEELWSRNLINLFSTPLSVSEYLAGLVAVNLMKAAAGLLAAALAAWLFYAWNIFPKFGALLPFVLNLGLFALAIGIVITGLIVRYTTRIQALAWSFAGLLMPFSCVFYPLSSLPAPLRPIALLLPTTHSFEGMRQALGGGGVSGIDFARGFALNVIYFAFAIFFFHLMFQSARVRGLLVKPE